MTDPDLDRLLKSAAQAGASESIEMPFGFDTRVVALWRAKGSVTRGLSALLRRVVLMATVVVIVASAGVYHQIDQTRELSEPSTNEFAIADSVIQDEFAQ